MQDRQSNHWWPVTTDIDELTVDVNGGWKERNVEISGHGGRREEELSAAPAPS